MQVLSFQIRYFYSIRRRHRRGRRSTRGRWDRSQIFQPRRRWLVRFRNVGLPLRRHPQILHTVRPTRSETDQVRHRSTFGRMESSKRQRSVVRRLQCCFKGSKPVFSERRSSGADRGVSVQGMLPVSVTLSDNAEKVIFRCPEEDYDPKIHNQIWHNNDPFVLVRVPYRRRKCRGCSRYIDNYAIKHREDRMLGRRPKARIPTICFFHCCCSCIGPRHPYFKPSQLEASASVINRLTRRDLEFFKDYGIDLHPIKRFEH
jgi:hypothetical protein